MPYKRKRVPSTMNSWGWENGEVTPCAFDKQLEKLGLKSEADWLGSTELRIWVKRYAYSRYVPEYLMVAWKISSERPSPNSHEMRGAARANIKRGGHVSL